MQNILAFLYFITFCYGGEVKYNSASVKNVPGHELKRHSFDKEITTLDVISYKNDEEQYETIEDFPQLSKIWMNRIGQEVMPKFTNLPRLVRINLYGNQVAYIKKESFSETPVVELYLKNNEIRIVERGSFGIMVNSVSLACNRITKVSPNWFQNPSRLRILNLRGNRISVLQENLFVGFTALHDINFGYNRIVSIEDRAFANRNQFEWMILHNNNITDLPATVFKDEKVSIQNMYINHNNLTFLSKKLMDTVTVTDRAPIYGNPWQCPCYDIIIKWIPWKNYGMIHFPKDLDGEPRCVAAQSFAGLCIESVDKELIHTFKSVASKPISYEAFCACSLLTDEC